MKQYLSAIAILFLSYTGYGQSADISLRSFVAYDAVGTQPVTTIAVGEEAQFKYTIKNEITNGGGATIPANTIRAVISFPSLHGNVRPYVYYGPSSFTSGFFTWTYDASSEVLIGKNTGAIGAGMGDENVTVRVKGYQEGIASSSMNLTQGRGISDDINNNYASAQIIVTLSPLAVNLISYTVTADKCEAILHWKSAEELNFSRYDIEYSRDGLSYTRVASVNGKGNNSDYMYSYTQSNGLGYYRLKMVDNGGRYRYSDVMKVSTSCVNVGHVSVYPNPVKHLEKLYVNISNYSGSIKGELFDAKGQRVGNYRFVNGVNELSVSVLSAGVYMLEVTAEADENDVQKQTFKVVVLR
jgi:hypothetical protein